MLTLRARLGKRLPSRTMGDEVLSACELPKRLMRQRNLFHPVNMSSRSSPVLRCLEIEPNGRIGLLHPIHRSHKRSIRLCLNYSGNPFWIGPTLAHGPTHERFSADYEHAGMVVSISVLFGIVVEKAERFAQHQNVVRLAG